MACLLGSSLLAQVPEYEWANALNGASGSGAASNGYAVATDPTGNIYSTGYFTGTIDFDPGPGVFNMSTTGWGMFVRKLDAGGNFLWAKMASSTQQSEALDVVATATNVFVTGYFSGTVDFDPGAGVVSKTSAGNEDMFLWNLTDAGVYSNVFTMGGTGIDRGSAVDMQGVSVVVAGVFSGSFDANPSATVTMITSNGSTDIFVAKISTSGSLSWIKTWGSTTQDVTNGMAGQDPLDIAVNPSNGYIYTTGSHGGAMDIDPGAGVFNIPVSGYFVQKLNSSGGFVWGNYSISGSALAIDVDNSGNVYTTGWFFGTQDMDPGPGTALLAASGLDVYVRKLDNNGNYVWAFNLGNNDDDQGRDIMVDPSGNVTLTGWYKGTVDFDPGAGTASLTNNGLADAFIASYDNNGNYLWAKKIGSSGDDRGFGITRDFSGAVYTSGIYKGAADFNTESGVYTLPLAGYVVSGAQDAYLHKLGSNCSTFSTNPGYEWAGDFGGTGFSYGMAVEADASGNVYTAGHFNGLVDFDPGAGTYMVQAIDGYDAFLEKQDASGNLVWVKIFAGKSDEYLLSLSIDNSGNIAVGGFFTGDIDLDAGAGITYTPSNGLEDIFLTKFDPSGTVLWSERIGGTGSDKCYGIKFDASGNLGCTGSFTGATDFDPGAGTVTLTSLGSTDCFVLKLNSAGSYTWVKQRGGTSSEEGHAICFDNSNNAYVTGIFSGTADFNYGSTAQTLTAAGSYDGFVLRLLSGGNFSWVKQIGGTGNDRATAICYDKQFNFVYVTGLFVGTCNFNGTSLTSVGSDDSYVLKMTNTGVNAWVKQIGELSGAVYTQGIATDDCGDVYATGFYLSSCDFDPNAGVYTLTPTAGGMADAFIFKWHHSGAFSWAKSMGGTSTDRGYSIDVDGDASVYTTGYFQVTADFNPGAAVNNLVSNSGCIDVFVQKLNTSYPVRLAENNNDPQTIETAHSFSVFPNPSNGLFTISLGTETTGNAEVFDMTGKLVLSVQINESTQQEIDLRDFAKGIYLVRVSDGTLSETKRIVVE